MKGKLNRLLTLGTAVLFLGGAALAYQSASGQGVFAPAEPQPLQSAAAQEALSETRASGAWELPTISSSAKVDPEDNGTYYVFNEATGQFLTGANAWGTQASVKDDACAWVLTSEAIEDVDENGETIQAWAFKNQRADKLDKYLFYDGGGSAFIDMGTQNRTYPDCHHWNLVKQPDGTYTIQIVETCALWEEGKYFAWAGDEATGRVMPGFDVEAAEANGDPYGMYWSFVSPSGFEVYNAKRTLYSKLNEADEVGALTDDAEAVYNNPDATVDECEAVTLALDAVITKRMIEEACENASPENPADVTFLIKNPSFDENTSSANVPAWDCTFTGWQQIRVDGPAGGEQLIGPFIEQWVPGGNTLDDRYCKQTLMLPAGCYALSATITACQQANSSVEVTGANLFVTVGDGMKEIVSCSSHEVSDMPVKYELSFYVAQDGTPVVIGVESVNTTANWIAFDNFELTYSGNDSEVLYDEMVRKANDLMDKRDVVLAERGMPYDIYDIVDEVVIRSLKLAENNASKDECTACMEEIAKAASMLGEVVVVHEQIKRECEYFDNAICEDWWPEDLISDEFYEIFDNMWYHTCGGDYFWDTMDEMKAEVNRLQSCLVKAVVESANGDASQDNPVDMTILVRNPHMKMGKNDYTEDEDMYDAIWGPISYWNGSENARRQWGLAEFWNTNFDMNQTIINLPAGYYSLEMDGFYRFGASTNAVQTHLDGEEELNAILYVAQGRKVYSEPIMSICEGAEDPSENAFCIEVSGEKEYEDGVVESVVMHLPNTMEASGQLIKEDGRYTGNKLIFYSDGSDFTIGVRKDVLVNNDWCLFDNFRLNYLGTDSVIVEPDANYFAQAYAGKLEDWDEAYTGYHAQASTVRVEDHDDYLLVKAFAGVNGYDLKLTMDEEDVITSLTPIVNGVEGVTASAGYITVETGLSGDESRWNVYVGESYCYANSDKDEKNGYVLLSYYNTASEWRYYYITWPDAPEAEDPKLAEFKEALQVEIARAQAQLAGYDAQADYAQLLASAIVEVKDGDFATVEELQDAIAYLREVEDEAQRMHIMSQYAQVEPGDYYIRNVATGQFLCGAHSWGIKASLSNAGQLMTLERLDDGKYTIDSHINNGGNMHYLGSNGYVDCPVESLVLEEVVKGVYSIAANGAYLAATGDIVDFNASEITNAALWQLVTRDEIMASMQEATVNNPVDVSSLIYDPGFGRNNQYIVYWNGNPVKGGNNDNMCAEKWNTTFDVYQVLPDMPAGMYVLKMQGFYRGGNIDELDPEDDPIYATLYANDDETELPSILSELGNIIEGSNYTVGVLPNSMYNASSAFSNGLYSKSLDVVMTEDGDLRIGVRKNVYVNNDWAIFDNFQLYYLGNDEEMIALYKDYNVAKKEAAAMIAAVGKDADLKEAVQSELTSLDKALAAAQAELTQQAIDNIKKSTVMLGEAIYANAAPAISYRRHLDEATVTITYPVQGATLYYNIDGGEAMEYTEPIVITQGCTVEAWGAYGEDKTTPKASMEIDLSYIAIHVAEPGTLYNLLMNEVEALADVDMLRITGQINSTDISYIKNNMPNLVALDLSDLNMTAMPSEMLYNKTSLTMIKLPKQLKTIGDYAMAYCTSLVEVEIPQGVETIGYEAFCQCQALKGIVIPGSVNTIGAYAFAYCSALGSVEINDGVTTIASYAFRSTGINTLKLPSSVTRVENYAFGNCVNLAAVDLGENLEYLGYNAFYSCYQLAQVTLPATIYYMDNPFYNCNNLKKVTCKAASLPTGYGIMGGYEYIATLYVPSISVAAYKNSNNFNSFAQILPIDGYVPETIVIRSDMTINDDMGAKPGDVKPSVFIEVANGDNPYCGNLWVNSDTLSMGTFYMRQDDNWYVWGWHGYEPEKCYTTLMNNGYMRADSVVVANFMPANYWTFFCLPFNVRVSDISHDFGDVQWVMRKYNGANRASGNGATWQDVEPDGVLAAGEGFILQHSGPASGVSYDKFTFPAINDAKKNDIFTTQDVTVELKEYSGADVFAHNRSWNLIGNPYPTFYDLRLSDFTAPYIVWKGDSYEALSPVDDEYILHPFEAFFVQRPVDKENIVFGIAGRQKTAAVRDLDAQRAKARVETAQRSVFNVTLSDGERSDRTRFVINETAHSTYEMERDASKFFADEAAVTLFTIENGVQMAINERPAGNGIVRLGMRIMRGGEYTITLGTKTGYDVELLDKYTGTTMTMGDGASYTFIAEAGMTSDRFELRLSDVLTGINSTFAAGDTEYYTTDGIRLPSRPTATGVYVVKKNGAVSKITVK